MLARVWLILALVLQPLLASWPAAVCCSTDRPAPEEMCCAAPAPAPHRGCSCCHEEHAPSCCAVVDEEDAPAAAEAARNRIPAPCAECEGCPLFRSGTSPIAPGPRPVAPKPSSPAASSAPDSILISWPRPVSMRAAGHTSPAPIGGHERRSRLCVWVI